MKKKALMIGNTDNLPGVPTDISSFYDFFASPAGGNWCSEELDILLDPPLHSLLQKIKTIANAAYDFVITIFSGHGVEADDGTVLAINGRDEKVLMQTLMNHAPTVSACISALCSRLRPICRNYYKVAELLFM